MKVLNIIFSVCRKKKKDDKMRHSGNRVMTVLQFKLPETIHKEIHTSSFKKNCNIRNTFKYSSWIWLFWLFNISVHASVLFFKVSGEHKILLLHVYGTYEGVDQLLEPKTCICYPYMHDLSRWFDFCLVQYAGNCGNFIDFIKIFFKLN